MSSAVIGFLVVFGIVHMMLITIPILDVVKAPFSLRDRLIWVLLLLLLPVIGVGLYRFIYRSSLSNGTGYEVSAAEERARSGTLSPQDSDK
ncbi:MAG: hypothetical protein GKR96_05010 [Gammaproteobacteria bacterium]|nr:hypothetical protein [Gammaproteobacteria bacterium]